MRVYSKVHRHPSQCQVCRFEERSLARLFNRGIHQRKSSEKCSFLIEIVHFPATLADFVSRSWVPLIFRSLKPKRLATSHLDDEEGPGTLLFHVTASRTEQSLKILLTIRFPSL